MSAAASLGLRTGSCGFLPVASAGSVAPAGRKVRGWGLHGASGRDKEPVEALHRVLRLVGRRRTGLLLLLAVAFAAFFCSLVGQLPGVLNTTAAGDDEEDLRLAFNVFDADGSGAISAAELVRVLLPARCLRVALLLLAPAPLRAPGPKALHVGFGSDKGRNTIDVKEN